MPAAPNNPYAYLLPDPPAAKPTAAAARHPDSAAPARAALIEELSAFSRTCTLNTPLPRDILPLLARDPEKQMDIAMRHMQLGAGEKKKTEEGGGGGGVGQGNEKEKEEQMDVDVDVKMEHAMEDVRMRTGSA
ncbi:hypothetical protein BDV95DRAFT_604245 [Massariosphaeria phaeospora]|uniref:Uncharacterized protein n=1 Tax=Massariosphaeria phaeospora TaxID=100035 RepID=A0A7C8ID24_9PLEO|nr:hypothetical protein BDV95DRAFT_604245 [Massariosphaeria phaeospora]